MSEVKEWFIIRLENGRLSIGECSSYLLTQDEALQLLAVSQGLEGTKYFAFRLVDGARWGNTRFKAI